MIDVLPLVSVIIACFALIVSIISLRFAEINCCRNVTPPTEMPDTSETQSTPEITITLPNGEKSNASDTEVYTLELDTEDLDFAYVVYADNRVEELDLEDMEASLNNILKGSMDVGANILTETWDYRYFFLYTADLNGECNLYLIYAKSSPEKIQLNAVSGIEVYGLAKAKHEDEDDYVGETLMAQKYVQLLKELPDYLCQ